MSYEEEDTCPMRRMIHVMWRDYSSALPRWWCGVVAITVATVPIPSFFLEKALVHAFHATRGEGGTLEMYPPHMT